MIIASMADMENGLFDYLPDEDHGVICGIDEAGRGPIAGPVTAAAVILPPDFPIGILDDSKRMSVAEREEAAIVIKARATAWAVAFVSHLIIDRINILQATMEAMARAYEKAARIAVPDTVMIDGNRSPDLGVRTLTVVKGDQKIPEIMAASIIAKTERDRIMDLCDLRWPEYGYSRHKGYPTKEHRAAVLKYGPSPIERMSFRVKEEEGSLLL